MPKRVEYFTGKMAGSFEIRKDLSHGETDQVFHRDSQGNLFRPSYKTPSETAAQTVKTLLEGAGIDHQTEVNGHITIWTKVDRLAVVAEQGEQDE